MLLSNSRKSLLLFGFCALLACACGSSPTAENKVAVAAPTPESEFPFPTKEPDVYQADAVITDGSGHEEKYFVARSGNRSRIDTYRDGSPWMTQISNGGLVSIDHSRRIFTTAAAGTTLAAEGAFNDLTSNYFKGKGYRDFEEIGRENDIVRYRIKDIGSQNEEAVVSVDTKLGLVVRQEFTSRDAGGSTIATFVYELRNLRTTVDDSLFATPSDYKQVSPDEFSRLRSDERSAADRRGAKGLDRTDEKDAQRDRIK